MCVVAFAIMTVFVGGAVPNHVVGLKLFTESAVVGKGKGFVRLTSL